MDEFTSARIKPYIIDANEALEFKLVRSVKDIEDDEVCFKPDMSHQVFGEKENIFGYQDLKVKLYYSAGSLKTYLGMTYTEKIPPSLSEGMEPDNVFQKVVPWISETHTTNLDDFINSLEEDEKFKPYGDFVSSFTVDDVDSERYFEVYRGDIKDKTYLEYHKRLRTFAIWYIDAANYVDVDDENWMYFNLYEKYQLPNGAVCYDTVGYVTVYMYYAYPTHKRPRIAQFLILPPFQAIGLGAHLLSQIYRYFVKDSTVTDITVEDPSQAFQRIRDYVDASNLRLLPSFAKENLHNGFNKLMAQEAKEKFKINKKQARRVYEILRLAATDASNEAEYRQYRLDVKTRLNIPFKREQKNMKKIEMAMKTSMDKNAAQHSATSKNLIMNPEQRMQTLDLDFRALEEEYKRVIDRLERRNEN